MPNLSGPKLWSFLSCFPLGGSLLKSSNEINHPFGLTLLHEHLYWTDWRTNSVYRAEINSGANITRLATGLNRPMDIHAYSVNPKQGESIVHEILCSCLEGDS